MATRSNKRNRPSSSTTTTTPTTSPNFEEMKEEQRKFMNEMRSSFRSIQNDLAEMKEKMKKNETEKDGKLMEDMKKIEVEIRKMRESSGRYRFDEESIFSRVDALEKRPWEPIRSETQIDPEFSQNQLKYNKEMADRFEMLREMMADNFIETRKKIVEISKNHEEMSENVKKVGEKVDNMSAESKKREEFIDKEFTAIRERQFDFNEDLEKKIQKNEKDIQQFTSKIQEISSKIPKNLQKSIEKLTSDFQKIRDEISNLKIREYEEQFQKCLQNGLKQLNEHVGNKKSLDKQEIQKNADEIEKKIRDSFEETFKDLEYKISLKGHDKSEEYLARHLELLQNQISQQSEDVEIRIQGLVQNSITKLQAQIDEIGKSRDEISSEILKQSKEIEEKVQEFVQKSITEFQNQMSSLQNDQKGQISKEIEEKIKISIEESIINLQNTVSPQTPDNIDFDEQISSKIDEKLEISSQSIENRITTKIAENQGKVNEKMIRKVKNLRDEIDKEKENLMKVRQDVIIDSKILQKVQEEVDLMKSHDINELVRNEAKYVLYERIDEKMVKIKERMGRMEENMEEKVKEINETNELNWENQNTMNTSLKNNIEMIECDMTGIPQKMENDFYNFKQHLREEINLEIRKKLKEELSIRSENERGEHHRRSRRNDIEISLKTNNRRYYVTINPSATVSELKKRLESMTGRFPEDQSISLKGLGVLDNDSPLNQYDIRHGTQLELELYHPH